jgi:hypothetical protein
MTDADDIDYLTACSYASGMDPIQAAEERIATLLDVATVVAGRAARGLPPLPAWPDASPEAIARKVLGLLLDAGWQPPSDETVQAAGAKVRADRERFDAWWTALTESDRDQIRDHYERHNEFPADLRPPTGDAS